MKIIYGFSNCTENLYNKLIHNNVAVMQPDQKYHGLLLKGLSKNGIRVSCYSGLPINRRVTDKVFINEKNEVEDNISYHYYKTLNIPGIRQVMIFFAAFKSCLSTRKDKDTFALCDCLNIANAYGLLLACKLRKIPIVTIVTDLPDMMSSNRIRRFINNSLFHSMDGFVFLTEQMNGRLNKKNKPYIVLEGHVDSEAPYLDCNKKWERELGKKVIIYAGSLFRLYGIQNLTEGFVKANIPDAELWIYGDGDYREELENITKDNPTIKYLGIRSNKEVVDAELRAALLVNPRPSEPEYTQYSFPSKNMEYMVSGTPLLTTRLPGMPKEYYPYVYLLDDESVEGIADQLKKILNISEKERSILANNARRFVLQEKSNIVQASKIISFLKKQVR